MSNLIYEIMAQKVKQVIDLLEENGWRCVRMKGDHRMYQKEGAKRPIVVPGNLNDDMAVGTLNSILRESGLK